MVSLSALTTELFLTSKKYWLRNDMKTRPILLFHGTFTSRFLRSNPHLQLFTSAYRTEFPQRQTRSLFEFFFFLFFFLSRSAITLSEDHRIRYFQIGDKTGTKPQGSGGFHFTKHLARRLAKLHGLRWENLQVRECYS